MCGHAGVVSLSGEPIRDLNVRLSRMSELIAHRGPDGSGAWVNGGSSVGLAHRRLSIIDTSGLAGQPMVGNGGSVLVYNGEIYNYSPLRTGLEKDWSFKSQSDTEVLLAGLSTHGPGFINELRGMFSFASWNEKEKKLICARDRFGIKPFYYAVENGLFYFASEAKALLPFLPSIETNHSALQDYFSLQYSLGTETLFDRVFELPPAHKLEIVDGVISVTRYWDVHFSLDFDHSEKWFADELKERVNRAIVDNLASDVEVGSYVSGGIDSSLVYRLARDHSGVVSKAFHGRFVEHPGYDESAYASAVVEQAGGELFTLDITADDFSRHISDVIYHLDYPVAGPGAFPQYMVSKLASSKVKAVLGGQGGDEIFGGYARYVIAYLEQCLSAAIDGTYQDGNYVVTLESIIPNLGVLREYKPMITSFWSNNLFGPLEQRYFDILDRSADFASVLSPEVFDRNAVYGRFHEQFSSEKNVSKQASLDRMMHFDFKNLLPALLQVEDRMSMAHGLESRVPFLDHNLVALVAAVPADIKFRGGETKRLLKHTFRKSLPNEVLARRDKMGFPVPLAEWGKTELREFFSDILHSKRATSRDYLDEVGTKRMLDSEGRFSRKSWALLNLELWQQRFHDEKTSWRF